MIQAGRRQEPALRDFWAALRYEYRSPAQNAEVPHLESRHFDSISFHPRYTLAGLHLDAIAVRGYCVDVWKTRSEARVDLPSIPSTRRDLLWTSQFLIEATKIASTDE
jgi:hypothetical protein